MADETPRYRHIVVGDPRREAFTSPGMGPKRAEIPAQDRPSHGASLRQQLQAIAAVAPVDEEPEVPGLNVEFESFPDVDLAFESLSRERSRIELRNVRTDGPRTLATVFIPFGKLPVFERLISSYLQGAGGSTGRKVDHQRLIDAIANVRAATLRALWTDDGPFPTDEIAPCWWEVWLPAGTDPEATVADFRRRLEAQAIPAVAGDVRFPERSVLLVKAAPQQLSASPALLNSIAELRGARATAAYFDELPLDRQAQLVDGLLARTTFPAAGADVPHVCLLDSGVTRGHPLLAQAIAPEDVHTVEPAWGTDDSGHRPHGTGMSSLALYGDLAEPLSEGGPISVRHRVEVVKLLPSEGPGVDPAHHAHVTIEAVARPEVGAPDRCRVFAMAVTAEGPDGRGKPSAWSAAIDRLAAGAGEEGAPRRLILVSAGNVRDNNAWTDYPASNMTAAIESPAQTWNAVTVGAYTDRVDTTGLTDYSPVAPAGGLSPFSRTSMTWDRSWPLKPDVVLEGGNAVKNALGPVTASNVSLLAAHHEPTKWLFGTKNATSAATALAGRMAAQVLTTYPDLWPETVRGLLVHSAEWTDEMRRQFLPANGKPTKANFERLVRACGFGCPNLERALWTMTNAVTLVAEAEITPFHRVVATNGGKREPTTNQICIHDLPWPASALEALGETEVEMRVTLSYFIEPNPSSRGVNSRYRYPSHGLRFAVKRPTEGPEQFEKRINLAAREEDEKAPTAPTDDGWLIGPNGRHRGSLHGDIWKGTAADLATRDLIAVYPSKGWWQTRQRLNRYDTRTRYSLLVSIRAPDVNVDLYTEIANQVGVEIPNQS